MLLVRCRVKIASFYLPAHGPSRSLIVTDCVRGIISQDPR